MQIWAIRALRQIEASAAKGIWDAHRGCATLAGAMLIQDDLVSAAAKPAVAALLPSLLGSDFDAKVPAGSVDPEEFAARILAELAHAGQQPKEIGHDAIYVAYVLLALRAFRIQPWQALLDALVDLVRSIKRSGPGWITINGKRETRMPAHAETEASSDYWIRFAEFDRPRAMESGDMQLGHLLTHGHALALLKPFGSRALLSDLDVAHRKRVRVLREASLEERDPAPLRRTIVDPRGEPYWRLLSSLGDMHGHAVKYAFSFLDLRRAAVAADDLSAFGRVVWPSRPEEELRVI